MIFADNLSYPSFTKQELEKIRDKFDSKSLQRIKDYNRYIDSLKKISAAKKLNRVNLYLNQLLPLYDSPTNNSLDYWETPKEFLIKGRGDCEDYAIIKYFTLVKLGFDQKKLFLTIVFEKYTNGYHMVLSYFEDNNSSPLILDNLSFRVLDLKARKDLKADIFINHSGIYKITAKNDLVKVAPSSKKFEELLEKVKENR